MYILFPPVNFSYVCYCQSRWLSLSNRCVVDIYGYGTQLMFCFLIMKMIAGRVTTEYNVSVFQYQVYKARPETA